MELPGRDPESTFLWVKFLPILSDHRERLCEVPAVRLGGFGLYQHVINVDFHVSPQLIS